MRTPQGAPAASRAAGEAALRAAQAEGAALALFPEAWLPGYGCPGVPSGTGTSARLWASEAARATGLHIALGFVDGDRCALGLAAPDGEAWTYHKRFPTPAESRAWRPGERPVVADCALGRVGLLVCADVLHEDAWRPLAGRVDLVLVAAAWPDYAGREATLPRLARPLLRPVLRGSNPWRERLLGRAARAIGAPVLLCNTIGPSHPPTHAGVVERFSGGSGGWTPVGERIPARAVALAGGGRCMVLEMPAATPADAGGGPVATPGWRAFAGAYRAAAATVRIAQGRAYPSEGGARSRCGGLTSPESWSARA